MDDFRDQLPENRNKNRWMTANVKNPHCENRIFFLLAFFGGMDGQHVAMAEG